MASQILDVMINFLIEHGKIPNEPKIKIDCLITNINVSPYAIVSDVPFILITLHASFIVFRIKILFLCIHSHTLDLKVGEN